MDAAAVEAVEAMAALTAAYDRFAAADLTRLSRAEVLRVADEYESLTCRMPASSHRILAALQGVADAVALGAKNWKEVLATRWRISTTDAHRRLAAAKELGPRTAVSGERLAPRFPALAAAQDHGAINAEHIAIIRDVVTKVATRFDPLTAAQMELSLVRLAIETGPAELAAEAARRLTLLDQDGPEPDDRERDKARGVTIGRQRRNGSTPITGELTPAVAASLAAFYAKFAAPGMCNPDDPQPCTSGTPSQAQIDNDHRSPAQRRHDALEVMARIALSTDLGTLNGLPVSVIVKTTVAELQAMAGVAVCGGGTTMSITDLIRLGAHAHWSLAVFDGVTGSAMDLFRTKRIASPAQRLMLIARDWGCTKPGCPVGPYGCQVHHAVADWGQGGNTNVDENGLACPPDNRLVGPEPNRWTTEVIDGVVHWHPPEHLDTGQATVNYRNRPDKIPLPDETAPLPWETAPPEPVPEPEAERRDDATAFDPTDLPGTVLRMPRGEAFLAAWATFTKDHPYPVTTLEQAERARRLTMMGIDISIDFDFDFDFDVDVDVDVDVDPDTEDTGSDREPFEDRPDVAPLEHEVDDRDEPPPPPEWFDAFDAMETDDLGGPPHNQVA